MLSQKNMFYLFAISFFFFFEIWSHFENIYHHKHYIFNSSYDSVLEAGNTYIYIYIAMFLLVNINKFKLKITSM